MSERGALIIEITVFEMPRMACHSPSQSRLQKFDENFSTATTNATQDNEILDTISSSWTALWPLSAQWMLLGPAL